VTRVGTDVSLSQHHLELLSVDLQLDIVDGGSSVEVSASGGVHPDWDEREVELAQQFETNRIRQRIDDEIRKLDANAGGYFLNPDHLAAAPRGLNDDIWVHRNSFDGNAMANILDAIRTNNEDKFVRNAIDFATGYPQINAIAKRGFIDSFSVLFETKKFPSIGSRQAFYHFILRCGHLY
jgi:hypothetical protein